MVFSVGRSGSGAGGPSEGRVGPSRRAAGGVGALPSLTATQLPRADEAAEGGAAPALWSSVKTPSLELAALPRRPWRLGTCRGGVE
jgi:hypothetical protein